MTVEPEKEAAYGGAAGPPSLDEAWAAAERALPQGWSVSVTTYPPGTWDSHATAWNFHGGVSAGILDGFGPTPAAALLALAAALQAADSTEAGPPDVLEGGAGRR